MSGHGTVASPVRFGSLARLRLSYFSNLGGPSVSPDDGLNTLETVPESVLLAQ